MTKARDISSLIGSSGQIDNTKITLDANEIPNLDTAKITTGTFADARISQSSVSQHATSFDDNKIVNDISTLALRQASDANRGAYNTNSQSVDVFQDATGIDTTTNVTRNASEYVSSVAETLSSITINSSNYSTYFGTQAQSSTSQGFMIERRAVGSNSGAEGTIGDFNPSNTYNSMSAGAYTDVMAETFASGSKFSVNQSYILQIQFTGSGRYYVQYKFKDGNTFKPTSSYFIWRNGSSYNSDFDVIGVDNSNNVTILDNVTSATSNSNGSIVNNQGYTSSISTSTYFPILGFAFTYTGNNGGGFDNVIFGGELKSLATNATGNFTGTTITAPSSVSSMGAIITYQDNAGTNALNTDIVLQLSADGGSNYSTATLTALPDFSTGIKMAKVNDLAVTAGTQLKYKISFANQASGSKEARIRGVALQY